MCVSQEINKGIVFLTLRVDFMLMAGKQLGDDQSY